jgi:hypothetical protein
VLARPFVLDEIGFFDCKHAGSDERDHDVGCAENLDSRVSQSGIPEGTADGPVVIDRNGVSPVDCNGER